MNEIKLFENSQIRSVWGKERIDEIVDPELTIDRALETYLKKGYSREWINQWLQAIQVRKELTDTWQEHGVQAGREFAILTNEITQEWNEHSPIQGFQRAEKGKPARQYEYHRASAEYAS